MNILVPTDFSEVSTTAVRYAGMLAKALDAKLILFHAVPHHSLWWALSEDETVKAAHGLQQGLKESLVADGLPAERIESHVFYQFPLNVWINEFIRDHHIDFAVIGTVGMKSLKSDLLGSFAMGMINHVDIPIIAVPPHGKTDKIANILYPTDLKNTQAELAEVVAFAKIFGASIHMVHVSDGDVGDALLVPERLEGFASQSGYDKVTVSVGDNTDIEAAITETMEKRHADLLVMFTGGKGFFRQLFTGSVTQELSRYVDLPMLAIKK